MGVESTLGPQPTRHSFEQVNLEGAFIRINETKPFFTYHSSRSNFFYGFYTMLVTEVFKTEMDWVIRY